MAGFKEFAHEIRKRATDYPTATVEHVAIYAKDNNRVYIIDENGNLVDFQVADIYCYNIDVSDTAQVGGTLEVTGNSLLRSDLAVGGVIDVSGEGYFWNDVVIDANLLVTGNVNIEQNIEVSGNSYFWKDVTIGDGLTVDGSSSITNDLFVGGNATVSGSLIIADKLTVGGIIDPTGLQLTPVSANPGDAYTIWANSSDGQMYFGATKNISDEWKKKYEYDFDDDFTSTDVMVYPPIRQKIFSSATISVYTSDISGSKHLGQKLITPSPTTGSGVSYTTANNAIYWESGTSYKAECVFKYPIITALTSPSYIILGWANKTDGSSTTTGAFFKLSQSNTVSVMGIAEKDSLASTTSTTYTLSAEVWYKAVVETVSTTSIKFSLYTSDNNTLVWTETLTNYIPTERLCGFILSSYNASGYTVNSPVFDKFNLYKNTL